MLPLNLSDTASTSQDASSLEFIAPIVGRQFYIQDASGRGLCEPFPPAALQRRHIQTVRYSSSSYTIDYILLVGTL